MKRSLVEGDHGEGVVDNVRTSFGMFIRCVQLGACGGAEQGCMGAGPEWSMKARCVPLAA